MAITPVLPTRLHSLSRAIFHYTFPRFAYRRLTSQKWREEEIELHLLPALADPEREAIDVGANVGHYSLQLSRIVRLVHAFEPHPRLAYVLKRCLPANVIVHRKAVSDQTGSAVLTVPVFERPVEGIATIEPDNKVFASARRLTNIRVFSTTLDSLVDRDIGFVKIDVEGHEVNVLSGATRLIRCRRPVVLVEAEERHRIGAVRSVIDYFFSYDYRGFFAFRETIFPVEEFVMDMQNPNLIKSVHREKAMIM